MNRLAFLGLACLATLARPHDASGQLRLEVLGGALVGEEEALVTARVGPAVSAAVHADVGVPLILEIGGARADFDSFGEAFHRYYGFFALSTEWMPVQGRVHLGVRFGVGAEVEDDTSEDDPGFRSSSNWAEALVPALVVRPGGGPLTIVVSDHILGPMNALFDPEEYSVEHRVRVLVGIRY